MPKEKILIVEDERVVAMDIQNRLKVLGYSVCGSASSGEDAVKKASELQPDLVLMDIVLKGEVDGIEAAGQIHEHLGIPVVYLTAFSDEKTLQRARLTGPYGYILKPFDDSELRSNIEMALYKRLMEARIEHLNRIIRAIRSVNQLIVREKDPDRLIQDTCDNLIATRGFFNAWIALLDENEEFMATAESGLGKDFLPMVERLKRGELTECAKRALAKPDVVVIKDLSTTCLDCPLAGNYYGRGAMSIRMEHGGKVYGLLTVSTPIEFIEEEELSLFKEIAGDISFALHAIELGKERKRADEALQKRTYDLGERVKELNCLYGISKLIGEDISLEELVQRIVNLIPPAWQYPEITCSRIILESEEYRTANFKETNWKQTSDITVQGEVIGHVDVCYVKEMPVEFEGPFLKEERELIEAISERLGRIIEQRQSQNALSESENKYRTLLENLPQKIFHKDMNSVYISCNENFARDLKIKPGEIKGKTDYEFFPKELAEKYVADDKRIISSEKTGAIEEKYIANGQETWVQTVKTPIRDEMGDITGILGIFWDISERRRLEEQLRQAQKMEAIGTLAGGIAHDFNNILGAIIGYTEIADLQVAEDNKAKESLKEVLNAGRRARDLVKQILAFSRKGEQERIPVQISLIVKEALKLLRSTLPTTIEIRQNIESDTGIVEADPTQIHQILMNLCTNAGHAMREEGGVLEVGIRDVEVGSWDSESGYLDMTPGPYLRLTVSDTGQGMTPEVLERIFEPYFTTKEKGVGTGLGLSVVHGIVKIYGGTIRAYSEPGKGTTFHVYLPRINEAKEMVKDESRPGVIPTGHERILLVDDEPVLVDIGKQMLERLGYEVTTRTSSIEALELFRAKPDQFDLVITDMTMPQMTGDRLARELMQIRPDIPIIICTGYSERITEDKAKGMGIKAFVMKPIVIRDLANTVREVLEGGKEKPAEGLILVIDDDDQLRGMLREMLGRAGYEVADAPNGKEGIRLYRENPADLVITDIIMPEKEGIETIMDLRREFPEVKIIAMSGGGRIDPEEYLHMAKRLGADRTFAKPVEREELLKAVREVLGT